MSEKKSSKQASEKRAPRSSVELRSRLTELLTEIPAPVFSTPQTTRLDGKHTANPPGSDIAASATQTHVIKGDKLPAFHPYAPLKDRSNWNVWMTQLQHQALQFGVHDYLFSESKNAVSVPGSIDGAIWRWLTGKEAVSEAISGELLAKGFTTSRQALDYLRERFGRVPSI